MQLVKNLVTTKGKSVAFTEQHREFAINCHYYSSRCYDYLRKIFTLPAPSTLRAWVSNLQCLPGILLTQKK